ncbi:hypothetical protein Dimus_020156 [Dionaea muscipula]
MMRRCVLFSLRQRSQSLLRSSSAVSFLNPNPSVSSFSTAAEPSLTRSSWFGLHSRISTGSAQIGIPIAGGAIRFVYGGRGFATRSSDSSNRPPKETILLDGCDFEHWLVVVEPPDPQLVRDEIIDSYIKTLAQVVGSEEEARMKIYSVSTKHYFAFGALVSEELSYKLKELPHVRWVLPDSYLDVPNKSYGGEPFIDGKAVPYDPKYHELWLYNHQNSLRNNDRNRNKRRDNMRTTNRAPPRSQPYSGVHNSQAQGSPSNDWSSAGSSQNQTSQPSHVPNQTSQPSQVLNQTSQPSQSLNQTPPPHVQPTPTASRFPQTPVPVTNYQTQASQPLGMQDRIQPPGPQPPSRTTHTADGRMPPSGNQTHSSSLSQFQNQAVPHGTSASPTHSPDSRMPSTGHQNQSQEASQMPNQAPLHPTSATPTHTNQMWNSRSQNPMPSSGYQNHSQQLPPSDSNLPNWNTWYSSSQMDQNIHDAGFTSVNQHVQPPASQMPFHSHTPAPPQGGMPPYLQQNPSHGRMPPYQEQNDFGSGHMPQKAQNNSFQNSDPSQPSQNHGYQSNSMIQGGNRDTPRLNVMPSTRGRNDQSIPPTQNHNFQNQGGLQYVQRNDFPRREVRLQGEDNGFQYKGSPTAEQAEYHGRGTSMHDEATLRNDFPRRGVHMQGQDNGFQYKGLPTAEQVEYLGRGTNMHDEAMFGHTNAFNMQNRDDEEAGMPSDWSRNTHQSNIQGRAASR